MGREVRMVPAGWRHPKNAEGRYIALFDGNFAQADKDWNEGYAAWQRGEIESYSSGVRKWEPKCEAALECDSYSEWNGPRPSPDDYMPEFAEGTATKLMMYETTSEGTPISPAFDTPEELAHWLADNETSAFGGMTATYEQWLATCKGGYSPSMVMAGGHMMSGVEASAKLA